MFISVKFKVKETNIYPNLSYTFTPQNYNKLYTGQLNQNKRDRIEKPGSWETLNDFHDFLMTQTKPSSSYEQKAIS